MIPKKLQSVELLDRLGCRFDSFGATSTGPPPLLRTLRLYDVIEQVHSDSFRSYRSQALKIESGTKRPARYAISEGDFLLVHADIDKALGKLTVRYAVLNHLAPERALDPFMGDQIWVRHKYPFQYMSIVFDTFGLDCRRFRYYSADVDTERELQGHGKEE